MPTDFRKKTIEEIVARVTKDVLRAQSSNLAQSTIEDGPLPVNDWAGNEMSRLGSQGDGTYAPVVFSGPTPPTPTAAIVSQNNVGGFTATWDGGYLDSDTTGMPLDAARVEMHVTGSVDTPPDLLPATTTRFGTIESLGGGKVSVNHDAGDYFVWLVMRSQAGKASDPSEPVPVSITSPLDHDGVITIIEQAGTGNRVFYSTWAATDVDHTQPGTKAGDTWRQIEPSPGTNIVAEWRWVDDQWVSQQLSSDAIANLDVGKLTAGIIQVAIALGSAGSVYAGDLQGVLAGLFGDGSFRSYSISDDGVQYLSVTLGGLGDNRLEFIKEPGQPPVASIGPKGDISGNSVHSDTDMFISGIPVAGRLLDPSGPLGFADLLSRGMRARPDFKSRVSGLTIQPGGSVSGVGQFAVDLVPGRSYRFSMPWRGYIAKQGTNTMVDVSLRMFCTIASTPGGIASDPTVSDINVGQQSIVYPSMGTGVDDVLAFEFDVPATDDNLPRQFKFLLGLWSMYGTFAPDVTNLVSLSTWVGTLEDIGVTPFVVPVTAPGAGTVTQYVTTWKASDSHAWLSDGSRYDTGTGSRPAAGSLLLQGGGVPGSHSAILFNGNGYLGEAKTVGQAFSGATINRLEVFLYQTWVEDDGSDGDDPQVEVRKWTGTTLPSAQPPPPSTQTGITKHYYSARSQGAWFDIPTTYINGAQTGLWIASPDWAGPGAHSNLAGAAYKTASQRPLLRATYTR